MIKKNIVFSTTFNGMPTCVDRWKDFIELKINSCSTWLAKAFAWTRSSFFLHWSCTLEWCSYTFKNMIQTVHIPMLFLHQKLAHPYWNDSSPPQTICRPQIFSLGSFSGNTYMYVYNVLEWLCAFGSTSEPAHRQLTFKWMVVNKDDVIVLPFSSK